ncbi:tumor necrosis factor ligand superfamily member 6 [Biomphalaria glabrata]|nr:tumor necrosis factor ligand superfamily member 6 [Biomphalaria glabrata]
MSDATNGPEREETNEPMISIDNPDPSEADTAADLSEADTAADLLNHQKIPPRQNFIKSVTIVQIFSSLSMVLSIAISIAAIVLSVVSTTDYNQPDVKQLYCVPCETLFNCLSREHPQLSQISRHTDANNTEQCCAHNRTEMKALSEMVLHYMSCSRRVSLPVINPTNFSWSKASIHMKLVPSTIYSPDGKYPNFGAADYNLKFATDEHNPLLEHNRYMEMLETGLKITESGLYLVYCSVHFKPDSAEPCKNFEYKTWSVFVKRHRPSNDALSGPILTATHTCCDECVREQETVYTAGVFMMLKQDFITVDVSGEGLVSYKPQSTYFGAALVWADTDTDSNSTVEL